MQNHMKEQELDALKTIFFGPKCTTSTWNPFYTNKVDYLPWEVCPVVGSLWERCQAVGHLSRYADACTGPEND